ncbi:MULTISPECIES: rhodanese-like domain-containing protein [unclassified Aureispira]|uniref:rhodanese-like domain-containing protein n=1 Tax=unclassified Aureispira TaxID=2649989 RepID=UPI00069867B3|nr:MULTISPECIES: rhodanese-like domain-containing protein [unclassified Aureispira]WMX16592.1 rhodanese-like domain-containing protein [Aureispira sp. CCB-E]
MKYVLLTGILLTIGLIAFFGIKWIRVLTASNYNQMLEALYSKTVPFVYPNQTAQLSSYVVLDTRAAEEFAISSLPNAIWVGYPTMNKQVIDTLSKNQAILVYCSVGYRSERIGEQLLEMGFTNVYNLYGGIFEWVNQGHPVVNTNNQLIDSIHGYAPSWGKWIQSEMTIVY